MMLIFAEQMARSCIYIIFIVDILNDNGAHDAHDETIKTSGIVPVGPIIKGKAFSHDILLMCKYP